TEAEQLKIALKRSRQETHISQQRAFSTDEGTGEGTGSKPGVLEVPSDDSEEELSWKSSEDEEVGSQEEDNESNDDSDDGSDKDSEETVKSRAGEAQIPPPIIPTIILEILPTFNSVFCFEERLRLLETSFNEY
nr:hypothetical protein [Tanacetum cinerariifolium]